MVLATPLRLAIPAITLALLVAGCGRSENLPPDRAAALVRNLDTIDRGVSAGECAKTRPALRRLQGRVRDLPEDVDAGVRTTLDTGVKHLDDLFNSQCKQKPAPVATAPIAPRVATPSQTVTTPQVSEPQVRAPTVPKIAVPKAPKIKTPTPPKIKTPTPPKTTDGQTGQTGSTTTGQTDTCGSNPSAQC
jgi:hypothetical protein